MLEIGKFFESALRDQSAELKRAALGTVSEMGQLATLSELLESEAGPGIRHLSLRDLFEAFADDSVERQISDRGRSSLRRASASKRAAEIDFGDTDDADADAGGSGFASAEGDEDSDRREGDSDQERIYLDILHHLGDGPQTIGQLAKSMTFEVSELRAYLDWMRSMGKVSTTGRARATRYHLSA